MGQNVAELGSGPPRNCPRLCSRTDSVANSYQNRVPQCRTLRKSKPAYYFCWVVCINEFRDEAVVWPWWSARSPTERQGSSDHTEFLGLQIYILNTEDNYVGFVHVQIPEEWNRHCTGFLMKEKTEVNHAIPGKTPMDWTRRWKPSVSKDTGYRRTEGMDCLCVSHWTDWSLRSKIRLITH